jgi:geranylgeranyl diphosphate synthase type I
LSNINLILNRYALEVEQAIKDALAIAPPFIQGVISYHFGWVDQDFKPANFKKGKFIRPTLCLLVFEALGGHYKDALPVAAAIEMIHNFTLMHDDIEDNDLERHGRPTVWAIWGKPLAINTGDYLYTLSSKSLYQLDPAKFSIGKIFSVLRSINQACLVLTEGQDLDLRFEQAQDVSVEMYLDMVYRKTGALLEASILAGALLGTDDQAVIKNYQIFAQNIGVAFQVRDDILGIWGDSAKTGKSADNDLRRKKKTLPVIYTLQHLEGQRQAELKALYGTPEPLLDDQVQFVRESLEQVKAYEYAQVVADKAIEDAFAALGQIALPNRAQSELEMVARFLVDRSH